MEGIPSFIGADFGEFHFGGGGGGVCVCARALVRASSRMSVSCVAEHTGGRGCMCVVPRTERRPHIERAVLLLSSSARGTNRMCGTAH